jgi:hypothetical protein
MKTTRCTACASEFTDAELEGAKACPACGATGVPSAIADDVTIKINWHELRILGIWASNWAEAKFRDEDGHRTLRAILARLQAQHPGKAPLSLEGELKDLARSGLMTGDIEVTRPDGSTYKIKTEKPS